MRRTVGGLGVALLLGAGGVAWWLTAGAQPATVDEIGDQVQTLPRGRLPVFGATEEVARLYRFAVENPDTLAWMPCTCGCASLGSHLEPCLLHQGGVGGTDHLHQSRRDVNTLYGHHA